jgi:septal ring factor EnvC (AmiA/AmiB activator)
LAGIEAERRALEETVAEQEARRDALLAELARYEHDIGALAVAARRLDTMVATRRDHVAEIQARRDRTAREMDKTRAHVAALLRSAYTMGQGDRLRLLLNGESPAHAGRLFGYYRSLARDRAARIAEINRLADELDRLRHRAADEMARLQRLAARQEETSVRLETLRQVRRTVLADLEEDIEGERARVSALAADAAALRKLIADLQRKAQIEAEVDLARRTIRDRRGRLRWPVRNTRLIHSFRTKSSGDLHADGVLLAAGPGSDVHAVHHGRVIYADWLRGYGLLLVIDHGDGYMSLYGHNEALLKDVGDWVDEGDVIALTGATGGRGNQGLYFAIRAHGRPVDPGDWCRERG